MSFDRPIQQRLIHRSAHAGHDGIERIKTLKARAIYDMNHPESKVAIFDHLNDPGHMGTS